MIPSQTVKEIEDKIMFTFSNMLTQGHSQVYLRVRTALIVPTMNIMLVVSILIKNVVQKKKIMVRKRMKSDVHGKKNMIYYKCIF